MRAAVDVEIQNGKVQYIVMDYPFGRDHSRFRDAIHLSVWLQTPLDIAMARRILRDLESSRSSSAQERLESLRDELEHYLVKGRNLYADDAHMRTADLVLMGEKPLTELRDRILEAIENARKRDA